MCPAGWDYPAAVFARASAVRADILYAVGGLYGNGQALRAVTALASREARPVTIAFNGDFNWFDVDAGGFERINRAVLAHHALAGNVEAALGEDDADIGCGCAYPEGVDDATVERSNRIHERLRRTAGRFPDIVRRLVRLPMHAVFEVGRLRIAVVHGDCGRLAGWRFDRAALDDPEHAPWLRRVFAESGVQVFASSHTCAPVCRAYDFGAGGRAVINNGAAGMPNFAGTRFGVITRIAAAAGPVEPLYGLELGGVRVEAIPLAYDADAWEREFLANWPAGSPAHESYWRRIRRGPECVLADAAPRGGTATRGAA